MVYWSTLPNELREDFGFRAKLLRINCQVMASYPVFRHSTLQPIVRGTDTNQPSICVSDPWTIHRLGFSWGEVSRVIRDEIIYWRFYEAINPRLLLDGLEDLVPKIVERYGYSPTTDELKMWSETLRRRVFIDALYIDFAYLVYIGKTRSLFRYVRTLAEPIAGLDMDSVTETVLSTNDVRVFIPSLVVMSNDEEDFVSNLKKYSSQNHRFARLLGAFNDRDLWIIAYKIHSGELDRYDYINRLLHEVEKGYITTVNHFTLYQAKTWAARAHFESKGVSVERRDSRDLVELLFGNSVHKWIDSRRGNNYLHNIFKRMGTREHIKTQYLDPSLQETIKDIQAYFNEGIAHLHPHQPRFHQT